MMDISLILPAYNEQKVILKTVREAIAYFEKAGLTFEIIVAADGNDGTRETIQEFAKQDGRVSALGSPERLGKGRGIQQGVQVAQGRIIGFADADNKVPITELDKVLPPLLEGKTKMVIGSRALKESKIERYQPFHRRIGSKGFRYVMVAITGLWNVPDTQCGFKFFEGSLAKELFSALKINGYMFDVELIYLARAKKVSFLQLPIAWRDDGDSRLRLFSGNVQNMLDLLKIRRVHG